MFKLVGLGRKLEEDFILMSNYIEYKEEDKIGIITINREDKLNALNGEVLDEIRDLLESLADNRELVG